MTASKHLYLSQLGRDAIGRASKGIIWMSVFAANHFHIHLTKTSAASCGRHRHHNINFFLPYRSLYIYKYYMWYLLVCICNLLGTADISDLLAEAEELLSGEGRRRRPPTFIEVSKENWDHIRPSLASNFRNGMRSRQWNIGELVGISLDS